MKRPAFQFYPADWRKDVELQSCSMAAQGLWINMMCVAHECEPYGHLTVNGKAMNAAQIGRQVGLSPKEAETLVRELVENGVARRTDDGVIYSARMVKDERLRNIRAESGRLGGNPNLLAGKVNQTDKQKPTPSSSSSSSSSDNTPKPPPTPPDGFAQFWDRYPKKVGKPAALKAFKAAKLNGHLPEVLADVEAKAGSEAWTKAGGQFVPNPATYLNQRRWEDEGSRSAAHDPMAGAI